MNTEPRWFWWTAERLEGRWWPLTVWGGDEYARRTLGIRVPGGMVFLCLWRFDDWSGPCARCGQWDPTEHWEPPHCQSCARELYDFARGCVCPSFLDIDLDVEFLDLVWPHPDCDLHAEMA